MEHTRHYIEQMIGKRVHLVLKNGEEYDGVLRHNSFRKFGFEINYSPACLDDVCVSYVHQFCFSDIKKIERITADDLEDEMQTFVASQTKLG